jgi:ribosome hibernation promoting factor
MKNMPIHITPHNIRLTQPLMNFIQKKFSALSRFAGDLLGAEIVLRGASGAGRLFSVSARVALPGRDLQANAMHINLHGAVNHLVARLARLARKRKTRLANAVRRPVKKQTKGRPGRHGFVFSP